MRPFLFTAALVLIGAALHAGMASNPDVHYVNTPAASASPSPQATLNPDLAAGIVTRFYRDVNAGTKTSIADLYSIASIDFGRRHSDDMITDYGYIIDPRLEIRGVSGRSVTYTLDYVYVADNKTKFFWERMGRWTFNHGAKSGWVLDDDTWDSVHLLGFQMQRQSAMVPVKDTVYSDGRHEFEYMGMRFALITTEKGWHIAAVSPPPPAPVDATAATDFVPDTNTADTDSTDTSDDTTDADANSETTTQTHFDDAESAQATCPSEIVVWVNTRSGVYHLPGTRWYGATEYGTYECEAAADAEGDRPSRNGQ